MIDISLTDQKFHAVSNRRVPNSDKPPASDGNRLPGDRVTFPIY